MLERSKILVENPFSTYQYTCVSGNSSESALHYLLKKIELGLIAGEFTIELFADVETAFENVTFDSIFSAARRPLHVT